MKWLIARFGRNRVVWGIAIPLAGLVGGVISLAAFGVKWATDIITLILVGTLVILIVAGGAVLLLGSSLFVIDAILPKRKEKPDEEYDPYERIQTQVEGENNEQIAPPDLKNKQVMVGGKNNRQVIK